MKTTIESYQSCCGARNYPYAGVEYRQECYCDTTFQPNALLGQTGCSMPCAGDNHELCGGSYRVSVFNSTNFAPQVPSIVSGWTYQVSSEPADEFSFSAVLCTVRACRRADADVFSPVSWRPKTSELLLRPTSSTPTTT